MNRTLLTYSLKLSVQIAPSYFCPTFVAAKTITSKVTEKKIAECCQVLNIPLNSKQDAVRQAFLELAKKYHPDSGSSEADMDKFVEVEQAFRTLTKHNTGVSNMEEVEKIVFDITHTAPQHRQYLSYEGYGHGTIFQRQKQYAQVRAQKAAINVMEHRIEKAVASDKTLMKKGQYGKKHDIKTKYGFDRLVEDLIQESMSKGEFENLSGKGKPLKNQNNNPYVDFTTHKLNEHTAPQHRQYLSYEGYGHGTIFQRQKQYAQVRAQKAAINVMEHRIEKAVASDKTLMKKGQYGKKHDIKTKYGFDRLVEDLIQESMSKGEFENLSGKGKPLKNQNNNPYVDFTTHKLNEVLINNGFTPEWITLAKEIDHDIDQLKQEIRSDRMPLGPYPLSEDDFVKWERICQSNRELASTINMKINKFNIIVPLLNKQKLHVESDKISDDILKNGVHSVTKDKENINVAKTEYTVNEGDDLFGIFFKALGDLLTFKEKKKV